MSTALHRGCAASMTLRESPSEKVAAASPAPSSTESGAPAFSASSKLNTAGSSSYSTAISPSASAAMPGSVAATAAIMSPT